MSDALEDGYRHPREAIAALGLSGQLTYRQLRALASDIAEVAPARSAPPKRWGTYEPEDLARIVVAVDLCGGPPALAPGRRLQRFDPVRRACLALQGNPYGRRDPLLDVPMVRMHQIVLAFVDGLLIDPVMGQSALGGLSEPPWSLMMRLRSRSEEAASQINQILELRRDTFS